MAILTEKVEKIKTQKTDFVEVKEQLLAIAARAESVTDVTVELEQGRYTLTEPFVLDAEENPTLKKLRLTIKAQERMRPTVSGLNFISGGDFVPVEGTPYYKAQIPAKEDGTYPKFHDFFRGDKRLTMASSPIWRNPFDMLPEERSGEKKLEGLYVPMAMAEAAKAHGVGTTELRIYVQWQHFILRVRDVDLTVTKEINGEPYALVRFFEEFDEHFVCGVHRANNTRNRETYFINNPAFLTDPDSFAYDWHSGTVYVMPPADRSIAACQYGYTELESLFVFKGMENVTVEGILFSGLTSRYVCEKGYFGTLSNREFRNGYKLRQAAILAMNARNTTIKNCSFQNIGSNGVQFCDRTVVAEIANCEFKDIAMGAIAIGNYREGNGWEDASGRTYNVRVINNYFEDIAYQYPSTACIFIGYVDGAVISHNTIHGCAYSGIAAGDGYSPVHFEKGESVNLRDVEISYNRVHNFMRRCRDGGAIYVTGANCTINCAERFNRIHHNFTYLDTLGNSDTMGYYLDGSASNWELTDNVADKCGMPLYTQYNISSQHTHHVTVKNFYSGTYVRPGDHRPHHDVYVENCCVTESLEELFDQYPDAKAIADGAGQKTLI